MVHKVPAVCSGLLTGPLKGRPELRRIEWKAPVNLEMVYGHVN